jgi:hypothetical protein
MARVLKLRTPTWVGDKTGIVRPKGDHPVCPSDQGSSTPDLVSTSLASISCANTPQLWRPCAVCRAKLQDY